MLANLSEVEYTTPVALICRGEWVPPSGTSQYRTPRWVGSRDAETKPINSMASKNKPAKRLHIESSDSESEKKTNNFPRFIVLESLENTQLSKISPFIIQKIISANFQPKTVKSLRDGKLLIEVTQEKHANFLLKMKTFHNIKIKGYSHEKLNQSKGVVRSQELSLCSIEEIKSELKTQGVIDAQRITIKKEGRTIETNTYILTFNSPTIPKELKIGYNISKVELFIPNPLRCYKCQKFGHHEDQCRNLSVCGRCGEKNPNHNINTCEKTHHCANCGDEHPAYAKICKEYQREKEIMTIKYKNNIPFPEARRMVGEYMKEKTYSQATKTATLKKTETNTNADKYNELVNELLKLGPGDWPSFVEKLRLSLSNQHKPNNNENTPISVQTPVKNEKQTDLHKPANTNKPIKPTTSQGKTKEQKIEKPRSRSTSKSKISTSNKYETLETMETEQSSQTNKTARSRKEKHISTRMETDDKVPKVDKTSQPPTKLSTNDT